MFLNFLELYRDDLPEARYIDTELVMWEEYWYTFEGNPPENLADLSFPNFYVALQIMATAPVTTCACEWSVSVLRRLKTYLRNTMLGNRLNGLAMLNVHREASVDVNEVIDSFSRRNLPKMKLIDILNCDTYLE